MTHDETQTRPQPEEQTLPEAQESIGAVEAAQCETAPCEEAQAETTSADAQS